MLTFREKINACKNENSEIEFQNLASFIAQNFKQPEPKEREILHPVSKKKEFLKQYWFSPIEQDVLENDLQELCNMLRRHGIRGVNGNRTPYDGKIYLYNHDVLEKADTKLLKRTVELMNQHTTSIQQKAVAVPGYEVIPLKPDAEILSPTIYSKLCIHNGETGHYSPYCEIRENIPGYLLTEIQNNDINGVNNYATRIKSDKEIFYLKRDKFLGSYNNNAGEVEQKILYMLQTIMIYKILEQLKIGPSRYQIHLLLGNALENKSGKRIEMLIATSGIEGNEIEVGSSPINSINQLEPKIRYFIALFKCVDIVTEKRLHNLIQTSEGQKVFDFTDPNNKYLEEILEKGLRKRNLSELFNLEKYSISNCINKAYQETLDFYTKFLSPRMPEISGADHLPSSKERVNTDVIERNFNSYFAECKNQLTKFHTQELAVSTEENSKSLLDRAIKYNLKNGEKKLVYTTKNGFQIIICKSKTSDRYYFQLYHIATNTAFEINKASFINGKRCFDSSYDSIHMAKNRGTKNDPDILSNNSQFTEVMHLTLNNNDKIKVSQVNESSNNLDHKIIEEALNNYINFEMENVNLNRLATTNQLPATQVHNLNRNNVSASNNDDSVKIQFGDITALVFPGNQPLLYGKQGEFILLENLPENKQIEIIERISGLHL